MKQFLRYFLQGLLFVLPIGFTVYIIYLGVAWVDNIIPRLFSISLYPGIGFVIVISSISLIGLVGSTLIAKPVFTFFENHIYRIPLVNLIYSSVKDLTGALVGDKKKFSQPVLVTWNQHSNVKRIGFITQNDLRYLDMVDKVAVYFPDSYNISGNLFIVPKDQVEPLHAPSGEVMKFVVSGGVSELHH